MISFTVYGEAVPKARARVAFVHGKTFAYTPKKTKVWEEQVYYTALEHRPDTLLDGPLFIYLTFYLLKPKSAIRKRLYPDKKPDADNMVKAIIDSLEKVIFTNDSRICDLVIKKRWGNPPRVEIIIGELP